MKSKEIWTLALICFAVSLPTSVGVRLLFRDRPAKAQSPTPATPPPPPPATHPTDWQGLHDSDRVPIQIITLGNGQAWFVVGTDTATWSPLVWLFDPKTGEWKRQP